MKELEIVKELNKHSNKKYAEHHQRFFKTGDGEYGEGDIFIGLTVPTIRIVAKNYIDSSFDDIKKLVISNIHEYRLVGYIILTYKYEKAKSESLKKEIYEFYINNRKGLNNWDLVDVTTPKIVGAYLVDKDKKILYDFAKSSDLWEKRISILATLAFIREYNFEDTIKISEILLNDSHDLIHKAVGWMLREMGKRDEDLLTKFLDKHVTDMPRTMLRYSIEKFDEEKRKYYLNKK